MALSFHPVTPRKRQIGRALEKADSVIRSGALAISRNFYGNSVDRKRPRYNQEWQLKEREINREDIYEFDENGETPQESTFTRVIKPHEIGFPNLPGTNVCWMNATLQIILGMKCLLEELETPNYGCIVSRNHYSAVLQAFLDVVRQHRRGRLLPVHKDLSILRTALATLDSGFAYENQQDAPEFLIRLLDNFREDFNIVGNSENNNGENSTPLKELKRTNCNSSTGPPVTKRRRVNPICDNLQFLMKENYCCTSCGMQSEKSQEHLALYVDIPLEKEASASIATALEQYMKIHLRELRCEKCHGEQCSVKTVFSQLPRFLLIQVKRYTYLEHLTQKITSSIGIPLDLNICNVVDNNVLLPKPLYPAYKKKGCNPRYEENAVSDQHKICEEESDEEEDEKNSKFCYRLTGILSHHGENPNTGHYVADVYHHIPQRWYHYDDENVECVEEDEILDVPRQRSGYMFVYTYRPLHEQLLLRPSNRS